MRRLRGAVLLAVGLVLLDLALGAWGPAPSRLEDILRVFELHPTRLWRLRPDLDTRFQGQLLRTDERGFRRATAGEPSPGAGEILCLGDSLTFGWGVADEEAWPARLSDMLERPVRNLAVPGYTSWQGLRLLEDEVLGRRPALVFASYGVNDVSKGRFFRSDLRPDSAQAPGSAWGTAVENLVMDTGTFRFLRNLALRRRDASEGEQAQALRRMSGAPPRVSEDEYAANLRSLAARLRGSGVPLVFVKMPLNLPLPPEVAPGRRTAAAELRARAAALEASGHPTQAASAWSAALELDPTDAEGAWAAWQACAGTDPAAARHAYDLLRRQEVWASSARHVRYNEIMEREAAAAAVPLLDVEEIFASHPGETLFNDPVLDPYHPNARGHRLVAEGARRAIPPVAPDLGRGGGL